MSSLMLNDLLRGNSIRTEDDSKAGSARERDISGFIADLVASVALLPKPRVYSERSTAGSHCANARLVL
jgi:hypothetical protein